MKYVYDVYTGDLKYYPPGSGVPLLRHGGPTPCQTCPKVYGCHDKTPDEGRKQELSEKNEATWGLYQAVHGARLDGSGLDDVAVENLGLIHAIVTGHERRLAVEMVSRLSKQ